MVPGGVRAGPGAGTRGRERRARRAAIGHEALEPERGRRRRSIGRAPRPIPGGLGGPGWGQSVRSCGEGSEPGSQPHSRVTQSLRGTRVRPNPRSIARVPQPRPGVSRAALRSELEHLPRGRRWDEE